MLGFSSHIWYYYYYYFL